MDRPACACSRVVHKTFGPSPGTVTREWWECADCQAVFMKASEVRRLVHLLVVAVDHSEEIGRVSTTEELAARARTLNPS